MPITPISDDLQVPQIPGVLQGMSAQINASYSVERWMSLVPGTLVAAANVGNVIPVVVDTHVLPFILSVMIACKNAPIGASIVVDVNKNGVTIFTNQGNRPTIAAGQFASVARTPDIQNLTTGDLITVDVDAVGSTAPGTDLTVMFLVKQGLIII